MKKFAKYRVFSTIDLHSILSLISSLIIAGAFIVSAFFFISRNLTPDFISCVYALGTKTAYTPSSSIARTMLSISIPSATFTKEADIPDREAPPQSIPSTVAEAVLPVAQPLNITYKSAVEEGYKSVEGIYLNNQSGKGVNLGNLLNKELDLTLSEEPSVLIIHTHTTESYTPSAQYNYTPSKNDRTLDENFNMIAVGEVIYEQLKKNGVNVIHDKTVNDYPSYSKSYSKSLNLIKSYTEQYPSIKIVIDVHRDAISNNNGTKLRPVTAFDASAAQVMLVVGTNASGLTHPNWETNLSFAAKLQHAMNSIYPTLARPINLRKERFNQHMAPYSFILEVGSNSNSLEEAKKAAEYFSCSLLSLIKL